MQKELLLLKIRSIIFYISFTLFSFIPMCVLIFFRIFILFLFPSC